jgi:hypothetical protein
LSYFRSWWRRIDRTSWYDASRAGGIVGGRQAQEELAGRRCVVNDAYIPDVDRLKEDAPMAAAKPHMCAEIG